MTSPTLSARPSCTQRAGARGLKHDRGKIAAEQNSNVQEQRYSYIDIQQRQIETNDRTNMRPKIPQQLTYTQEGERSINSFRYTEHSTAGRGGGRVGPVPTHRGNFRRSLARFDRPAVQTKFPFPTTTNTSIRPRQKKKRLKMTKRAIVRGVARRVQDHKTKRRVLRAR